jgi:hypothetical protein
MRSSQFTLWGIVFLLLLSISCSQAFVLSSSSSSVPQERLVAITRDGWCRRAMTLTTGSIRSRSRASIPLGLASNDEDTKKSSIENNEQEDENETDPDEEKGKSISLYELYEQQEKAARKVNQNLLLGYRLEKAFNASLWGFVIVGFALNFFGYGYVLKDGHLDIDTLENRQFQRELNRVVVPDEK